MGIPLRGSKTKPYTPHPEGTYSAVVVDIQNIGLKSTPWGEKEKIKIVWETDQIMADGRPYTVSQWYTNSLNEKANLRKVVHSLLGYKITNQEAETDFDSDILVGKGCLVSVSHRRDTKDQTKVYDSVDTVTKLPSSVPALKPSGKYQRKTDKPAPRDAEQTELATEGLDSDIPF